MDAQRTDGTKVALELGRSWASMEQEELYYSIEQQLMIGG